MEAYGREYRGLSGLRVIALFFSIIGALLCPSFTFADTDAAVASRTDDGGVIYYSTLHEAFTAAGGSSSDNPDEITLLADIVIDEPVIIESGRHIRLIAGDGGRTITRGVNINYPLFWLREDDSSLTFGAPAAEGETSENSLAIDGGYLAEPSIEARAPLVVVNGRRSRLVMYDDVSLQNNYNHGDALGGVFFGNGGCVFIRTVEDDSKNLAAFVMKGGVIRGNTNNTQNPIPCGGGVYITGFGLFVMEGGEIRDNTAYLCGGGLAVGSRGSFKKTGGVIYGKDAPEGLRNTVIDGAGDPRVYGYAVCVALVSKPMYQLRDDTVGKDDVLSYAGSPTVNGVFGEGEKWELPGALAPFYIIIAALAVFTLGGVLVFFIVRTRRKKQAAMSVSGTVDPNLEELLRHLTSSEKEVFDLLLTNRSLKEIAGDLDISYSGANFHVQNIYEKLGVKSRTEFLIRFK